MANTELLNSKLTAVADEIRELSGAESLLSLDAMASNVKESNGEIFAQKQLIEQAAAALEGKVSPALYEQGYADGYAEGEGSRYPIEDGLLAKTLTEYSNPRPVTIGNRFFSYFSKLEAVNLPNAVAVMEYGFTHCTALKEIVLPNVTDISAFAFQNCTELTRAEFGKLKALQSNVFTNTNMTTVILRRTDAITTNNSTAVFNNTPISRGEGNIYVPDALLQEYRAASNWSAYAAQIKPISELEADA